MQLTKQQKIYAAVLSLAVACFAVDRWVIGPADDSAADTLAAANAKPRPATRRPPARRPQAAAPAPGATAGPASTPAANAAAPSVALLAAHLREVAAAQEQPLDLERVKDAFRPPPAFLPPPRAEVVTVVTTPASSRDEAAEFLQAHKLEAVMKRSNGGVAIVDKKTVKVGQSYAGFRLVAVKDRSAVFRRGRFRAELKLPDDVVAGEIVPWGASENVAGADVAEE